MWWQLAGAVGAGGRRDGKVGERVVVVLRVEEFEVEGDCCFSVDCHGCELPPGGVVQLFQTGAQRL